MRMQTLYGLLYLEINLAASLLVLFIRIKTIGISRMVSQRNFSMAIDAEIVFFLSDTVAVLIVYGLLPFSRFGLMAAKTVYFFSTALMCFFWFIYFEHMQGSAFVADRKKVLLSSCLVWVLAVLLIVNLFLRIRVKSLCRLKKDMEEKNKKTSGIKEADPVMPDPEKIIRNTEADTEDIVDFMHEEIKKRPVNRRKFLRQARETVGIAVIFGVVSCIVFAILLPVINNVLYPDEKTTQTVTLPEEKPSEELSPEDMVENERKKQADAESKIQALKQQIENLGN